MLDIIKNTTGKILRLFFQDPEKEYYLREIGKHLNQEPGHFQAALKKLVKEGILQDERRANLRYFKLNKDYPIYEELKKIISKTIGLEASLKEMIKDFGGIQYALIFGSIAKNKESSQSDIDLLLIGEVDPDELIKKVNAYEEELKREINYHLYSKHEIVAKLKANNEFLMRVFAEPKITLKGNLDDFTKFN